MRHLVPVLLAVAATALMAADYAAEVAAGRQKFDVELREKDSPLSLLARRTIRRGTTQIEAGDLAPLLIPKASVEWDGSTAVLIGKTRQSLKTTPDSAGIVRFDEGSTTLALHWNGKTGELFLRIYDQDAPKKRKYPARVWYEADRRYRVVAKWEPFSSPETITVTRADGTKSDYPSPGMAVFSIDGQPVSMRALKIPDGRLFFPFKDKTAPRETYGAGRFLYASEPVDGKVVLEFNLANNPNCAFSPYWSCVLPLKENILSVRIPAGEKVWPGL